MKGMLPEEYAALGNLSNRISEILHMPAPRRKLQPILKPIKIYKRPKAAFKKRTPLQVDQTPSKKKTERLCLDQMLSFPVITEAKIEDLIPDKTMPTLPKISPIRSNLSQGVPTSKLSFQQSEMSIETSLLFLNGWESYKKLDPSVYKDSVSQLKTSDLRSAKGSQEKDGESVKRIDHIVLPTASLETISSDNSSADKTKKVKFPCLQLLPRSAEKPKEEIKEKDRRHFADSKNRKPKFKKRIMTLLEMVSKRDRFMKTKSNVVNPMFEANLDTEINQKYSNMRLNRYKSLDNDSHQSKKSGFLMFEDFDDLQFNLNSENINPLGSHFPLTRISKSKDRPDFWKSSKRLSDRQLFEMQRRNNKG